jgi:hypothetical protein
MSRLRFFVLNFWLVAIGLTGCMTPPTDRVSPIVASAPAADALVTERGILTVRGRQFALNGYLAESRAGGRRLIVTEMFGHVLADVLVKPDGAIHVMHSSPPFRPAWIARYVVGDMQCIFGGLSGAECPVRKLSATHFVIERRWYKLDLQIVETQPGPQPPEMFDETQKAEK